MFDLSAYLARIGHHGAVRTDLATLRALHCAHVGAIPFENLDIQRGLPVRTDPDGIFAKLVGDRRGGYCFEQNGLLFLALTAVGFDCRRVMGRVRLGGDPGGLSHLILLVTIEGVRFVCDVGFGSSSLVEPLPLDGQEHVLAGDRLRVRPADWHPGWEVEVWRDDAWSGLYWFNDQPLVEMDIVFGNHFTSCHPHSRFVQNRIAARSTPHDRHTLFNNLYRLRRDGELVEEVLIHDEASFRAILADRFGLSLPPDPPLRPIDGIAR